MECAGIMLQNVCLRTTLEVKLSFNYCFALYQTLVRPTQLR
jgi:hypothetical protein